MPEKKDPKKKEAKPKAVEAPKEEAPKEAAPPPPAETQQISLTDEQLEELRDAFTLFDKVGDDKVCHSQIIDILRSLKLNPLTCDVEKVIKDSGLEGVRVDFPTFASIYEQFKKRKTLANYDDMIEMFKCFDREGTKMVFGGEFRMVLVNMGDTMNDEQLEKMIAPSENADGYIPYESLLEFVLSK
ncbi:myosin light chain 6B-like [Clytia hemisphaerica]|uniref:EF-hand domain-containing protein n=1 Tax=Clytia hemisphaerica TaxID=252671 RepID=A0A7M5V1I3_9CNID|eukprot:TCONS_00011026-protein